MPHENTGGRPHNRSQPAGPDSVHRPRDDKHQPSDDPYIMDDLAVIDIQVPQQSARRDQHRVDDARRLIRIFGYVEDTPSRHNRTDTCIYTPTFRIFGCAEDTPSRHNQANACFCPRLFVSLIFPDVFIWELVI